MNVWLRTICGLLFAAGGIAAQDVEALIARLHDPAARVRATLELRRIGAPAARALVDRIEARADASALLAEVLAELGDVSAGEVKRLFAMVPQRPEPVRTSLLRALTNGVLYCDADAAADVRDALPAWSEARYFYTASADTPTFAWNEYIRLKRRLLLRRDPSVAGLQGRMAQIFLRRGAGNFAFGGRKMDVYDMNSFGQHNTREEFEAIAELSLRHGEVAVAVVTELGKYLSCEEPRPGIVLQEHCAGIGEVAPVPAPEVKLPTLWRRDDWRFAVARAVLAIGDDDGQRTHALRHLLHAPLAVDRLAAIETVRAWPPPWTAFAADLAACLRNGDRVIVRAALVTLGQSTGLQMPVAELEALAVGDDRELALLSRRLLR